MKNKWWICLVAVVAVLVLGVLGLRIWFLSPGIHTLGKDIHVNVTQKCYIIDGYSGEIVDETTVTVKGGTKSTDREVFDGNLLVLGYHNTYDGTLTALKAVEKRDNGSYIITHMENCAHFEEGENGIIKEVEHFCDYSYYYYIYPEDAGKMVVTIDSLSKSSRNYAVCAENEEAALVRYKEFISQEP